MSESPKAGMAGIASELKIPIWKVRVGTALAQRAREIFPGVEIEVDPRMLEGRYEIWTGEIPAERPVPPEVISEMVALLRAGAQMRHGDDCDGFSHSACRRRWDEARIAVLARVGRGG